MSGINEIQSRIQSIQTRVANPPMAGRFNAVFEAQMAAANARSIPATEPDPEAPSANAGEFIVTPQSQVSIAPFGGTSLTLGAMLGITGGPTTAPRSGTVTRAADLNDYMTIHNIESRNGRLSPTELSSVSGGWNGTGYLLPPAASAWEEMRAVAATEGIDLRAIDTYRSWETVHLATHQRRPIRLVPHLQRVLALGVPRNRGLVTPVSTVVFLQDIPHICRGASLTPVVNR